MSDEEIFNEWKSEQYKDQSTEEKMEFVEHLHTFPCYFKKAFIAGLKSERQEKWHDLRKNPKDLPEPHTTVLDENGDKIVYIGYGKWEVYSEYYERYIEVDPLKAWCEVPTFKE